jgi:hypothetical protein
MIVEHPLFGRKLPFARRIQIAMLPNNGLQVDAPQAARA